MPGSGQTYFTKVSGTAFDSEAQEGQTGFWVDSDNDGNLEVFVKNYFGDQGMTGANRLYEYSAGTFTNIIDLELGRAVYQSFNIQQPYGHGTICSFTDYDWDYDMDVAFSGLRKALYQKTPSGYMENTNSIFPEEGESCKGIAWGDYDNNGYPDLYVTTGSEMELVELGTHLFRNNGDGTFTDVASTKGVFTDHNTWAAAWGDYDNDGFLDLFVTCSGAAAGLDPTGNANLLYHNNGPPDYTFTNVAPSMTPIEMKDNVSFHKTAAWADYNNDGFLDLVVKDGIDGVTGIAHLLKNTGNSNHWIEVKLDGRGPGLGSNDRGIGARVQVQYSPPLAASRKAYRINNGGGGGEYDSQGSQPLHFGIGAATSATVTVTWPSGRTNSVTATAGSIITITEPSS